MNKRITSILLCFVLLVSMLGTYTTAYALENVDLKVSANKTTANPGDTVDFSVSIGKITKLGGMDFWLRVPDGLTIVDSSIKLPDGLETTLDSDGAVGAPTKLNGYYFNYSAQMTGYTGTEDLVVVTFSCTVNNDCPVGDKVVTIQIRELFDNDEMDDFPYTIYPATVEIEAKPVAVTGVTIEETLSVSIGGAKTPAYEVLPAEATNKAVSFTSNNPSVATVNSTTGLVTGHAEGTATITITTADGNFTDTCIVTVSCSHANVTDKPAVPGTCQAGGNDAYKVCDGCGQLFDALGVVINAIPATGKDMNNHTGTAVWTKTADTHAKAYTCCGTPVVTEASHEWGGDDTCDECDYVCSHSGGTATCQSEPVCENCGLTYGSKDADNHVGGTTTINAAPADHKAQQDGYTGDTQCQGCSNIIGYGTAIPAGPHTPAAEWTSDGADHWRVCAVNGCGVEIANTREAHDATGANVATCQKLAVCDTCSVSYGQTAQHQWATGNDWSKDASGHWYACGTPGCLEKKDFAPHTPDHQGPATEEYAILCSTCQYEIEPQVGHEHTGNNLTPVIAQEESCNAAGNKAYYICSCGKWFWDAAGTQEIANHDDVVIAPSHKWGTTLVSQGDNGHAYVCTVPGCLGVDTVQPHNLGEYLYDADVHWKECDGCDYETTRDRHVDANGDGVCDICLRDGNVIVEIPFVKFVQQTGTKTPGQYTFTFEVYDYGNSNAEGQVDVVANTVTTNGVGTFNSVIKLKLTEDEMYREDFLAEGFYVREKAESVTGWTYSDAIWLVMPAQAGQTGGEWEFYLVENGVQAAEPDGEMAFTNSFYGLEYIFNPVGPNRPVDPIEPEEPVVDPVDPEEPAVDPEDPAEEPADEPEEPAEEDEVEATDVPKTNDSNNPLLWIVVMMAAAVGMAVSAKSRTQR